MGREVIWLNGHLLPKEGAHLSALDRGFTLGDGVFETLRAVRGKVFRLDDHLERFRGSAATIGLEVPLAPPNLGQAIAGLLEATGLADAVVRLTLTRGVPRDRGILPTGSATPALVISAVPFAGYPEGQYRRGFAAAVSRIRRNETSPLACIKSCNYLDPVLARMEAAARGAQEALLLNTAGWLACGASSNLFVARDGALATPSLDCGVLNGVTRRTVVELAAKLGVECSERRVSREELEGAEEAFVTNTALGVMPVVSVDGVPVGPGTPGPIAGRLRAAYQELVHRGS